MVDERRQTLDILGQVYNWKFHSLADYIAQADPYVDPGAERLLLEVQVIAVEDKSFAARLGRTIEAFGESPHAPAYESYVAELNYLSIKYLAGRLAAELEKQLVYLRQSLDLCHCKLAAVQVIRDLIQVTESQLTRLKAAQAVESQPLGS